MDTARAAHRCPLHRALAPFDRGDARRTAPSTPCPTGARSFMLRRKSPPRPERHCRPAFPGPSGTWTGPHAPDRRDLQGRASGPLRQDPLEQLEAHWTRCRPPGTRRAEGIGTPERREDRRGLLRVELTCHGIALRPSNTDPSQAGVGLSTLEEHRHITLGALRCPPLDGWESEPSVAPRGSPRRSPRTRLAHRPAEQRRRQESASPRILPL